MSSSLVLNLTTCLDNLFQWLLSYLHVLCDPPSHAENHLRRPPKSLGHTWSSVRCLLERLSRCATRYDVVCTFVGETQPFTTRYDVVCTFVGETKPLCHSSCCFYVELYPHVQCDPPSHTGNQAVDLPSRCVIVLCMEYVLRRYISRVTRWMLTISLEVLLPMFPLCSVSAHQPKLWTLHELLTYATCQRISRSQESHMNFRRIFCAKNDHQINVKLSGFMCDFSSTVKSVR